MTDADADDAKPDLHAVAFDELVAELAARCEAMVFGAIAKTGDASEDGGSVRLLVSGERVLSLGVLVEVSDYVRERNRQAVRRPGGKG